MSDDLVTNLAWLASPDAERLSDYQRINEFVRCGLDAATALTEARAEIEMLRAQLLITKHSRDYQKDRAVKARSAQNDLASGIDHWKARAVAAEAELSTLRARVREVVEPFADAAADLDDADKDVTDIWEAPCAMQINVGHLRAARQLMEDLK